MELNTNWKNIHWKSIETSYRNAPYFEFYENELKPGYDFETEYLFDFNFNFFLILLSLFKIKKRIEFTEKYEAENPSVIDVRQDFHPKRQLLKITPYSQVFSERSGFINDLSAMDYLFNCGPELLKYKNS
jgi:hypothetical protein